MLLKTLVILCLTASIAKAEPKNIGRLSDGRAFRIDESGMRLIDQVAELEVRNDELKRQVLILEDELKEKSGVIESLRAGVKVAPEDKLREQDLMGNTASGLPKAATTVCNTTEVDQLKQKLAQLSSAQSSNAQQELTAWQSKSKQLEEENSRSRDRIALLSAEKNQLLEQLQASKTPDSERNQLVARLAKLEQEKDQLLEENNILKSSLANSEQTLASKSSEAEEARRLQRELASLKEQLVETQKEALKQQESTPRSRMSEASAPVLEIAAPVRTAPSPEAKNLLVGIQSKIMKRKSLLDNVSKSGKGISISATNLITSNGVSLDRLRQAVNTGSTDVTVIKGLTEISNILDTDISTASRLAH